MRFGNDSLWIERLEVGPIGTNCYIVTNVKDRVTMVVDPGGSYSRIKKYLNEVKAEINSRVVLLVNTHGHWDHIYHNADILRDYPEAKLYIHRADAPMLAKDYTRMIESVEPTEPDGWLEDGASLMLGTMEIQVFHTPGHSQGGVCLLLENQYLLSGDTLFKGSVGRTDFPGGSFQQIIDSIRVKLLPLGDDVVVLPGHGPSSTIGEEKKTNMFLQ